MVEGGLFSALPTDDPEPFTVVAQSVCEAAGSVMFSAGCSSGFKRHLA